MYMATKNYMETYYLNSISQNWNTEWGRNGAGQITDYKLRDENCSQGCNLLVILGSIFWLCLDYS